MSVGLRYERIKVLENKIGYTFEDTGLLKLALTHSSYANEHQGNICNNERLEFLGDSVLGLVISDFLFKELPDLSEGRLTRIRAGIVSERSLVQVSRIIGIGGFILLGKGEENTGGRNRSSILADALEALIGAIYLDGGIGQARDFIINFFGPIIDKAVKGKGIKDYKTELQELLQKDTDGDICYRIIEEKGPDHDKKFLVQVFHRNELMGEGMGKSKKEAEQEAAKQALLALRG